MACDVGGPKAVTVVTTIIAAVFALRATPAKTGEIVDTTNVALDPGMKVH